MADQFSVAKSYFCFVCLLGSLILGCQPQANPSGMRVQVGRVVSGQTLELVNSGRQPETAKQVRLLGIEAPDLQQHPWGAAAQQRLAELIGDRPLRLEFDVNSEDRYQRLLGYVWLDNVLLNEQLVKEGYVLAGSQAPNIKYEQRLHRAQERARLMGLGIWHPDQPMRQTPTEFRHQK
ncbi:MAG: thermonuclease family protein [Cyanothece sp. SIO1E1]|nr:thermonuclease family protein [Cyanothece sp. SIO1E1]